MQIKLRKLNCREISDYKNSNRSTPFWLVQFVFNFQTEKFDRSILKKIEEEGQRLANVVNEKAANDSQNKRPHERKLSNAIAGVLAEYCWKTFLNTVSLDIITKETPFNRADDQIDLETLTTKKTIEVRSSFPRNGIDFAICHHDHEFDILGPYTNNYKPNEIQKDFYLRTLYHTQSPTDFLKEFKKDGFVTTLTGGATWDMMADDDIAIVKALIPEDDISDFEVKSNYRVIPFSRALDCAEIYKAIKENQ